MKCRASHRLLLALALLTGCAGPREHLDQALLAERSTAPPDRRIAQEYTVRYPDVVEVTVGGDLKRTVLSAVGLDGRIDLGPAGKLRVEGLTVPQIVGEVAGLMRQPPDSMGVRVAEYRSQHVYLGGQGNGLQRAVAYQGPETVLDLLRRVGGIKPEAAPHEVYVVRAGVAEGRPPEYFRVDLDAIVMKQDQATNLRLQPSDLIYVGETRRASIQKCFPQWLQPLYRSLCGLRRPQPV